MANVPHDVPVEKDIKQLVVNNKNGTSCGDIILFKAFETYKPVPNSLHKFPIAKANIIKIDNGIIPDIPLIVYSIISFAVKIFLNK